MVNNSGYKIHGWRHELWDVVRFFRSIGKNHKKLREFWLDYLRKENGLAVSTKKSKKTFKVLEHLPLKKETVQLFFDYLEYSEEMLVELTGCLRTEEQALRFCNRSGVEVDKTSTQSKDHHQSSKSLVAAVTNVAVYVANDLGLSIEQNPQNRCVWLIENKLFVTARNLDGAIPALLNPYIIWEIKEYWGKTKGGSKMSDAVYECQLVGREIREFEEESGINICHVAFLDGRDQWGHRVSDFVRFIDLFNQGIIDYLIVGKQVESDWENILREVLNKSK